MKTYRSIMLSVLVLGFGGTVMAGACGSSEPTDCLPPPGLCTLAGTTGACEPEPSVPTDCSMPIEQQCMRYRIPLAGDPNMDAVLRAKYIAAFGSACYVSEVNTFDCFYKDWKAACADAVKIGEVAGGTPYDKGYTCQPVGNGDYTLQIGPDVANKLTINFQAAPRQTPLIDINGTPTAVNGPYRNLTEPQNVAPGKNFHCEKIDNVEQWDQILQVNRKAHAGAIHSDLAGFTYPCGVDENCNPKTCTEPFVLKDPQVTPNQYDPERAEVHHVVRAKDKRGCPWGTNSNSNAAVISVKLNRHLTNSYPSAAEVLQVNKVLPYAP
ncbi:MAG TPA: hypothetical protein PK156_49375 [Polyangium sp.]|nr:hypothetical protein [Polyangium sp.]